MPEKHVIILGAGASRSSGYPLANELRLLMSSENYMNDTLVGIDPPPRDSTREAVRHSFFRKHAEAIELFRHGGFGTLDEFSSLAGKKLQSEIQELKRFLAFALALRNPEKRFEQSDYYKLVQRLFIGGDNRRLAWKLRPEISILTFNYDAYLPYLVEKAHMVRCKVAEQKSQLHSGVAFKSVGQLAGTQGFCLLELHGSIACSEAQKEPDVLLYADLFENRGDRLEAIFDKVSGQSSLSIPKVFFPWEAVDDTANVTNEVEGAGLASVWDRACADVRVATKLSFVGLSMHGFMKPAFKKLLAGRRDQSGGLKVALVNNCDEKSRRRMVEKLDRIFGEARGEGQYPKFPAEVSRYDSFGEFMDAEMN